MKFDGVLNNLFLTWDAGLYSTEHAFKDRNVAAFIKRRDLHFDVVVLEQFFHDSWLLFAHKFNAPIVTIATLGHANYFDHAMGFLTPSAFVPHSVLTFNDNMSFAERCINIFWGVVDAFLRKYYYMAKMQQMADKYFTELDGKQCNSRLALIEFYVIFNSIYRIRIVFDIVTQVRCHRWLNWSGIFRSESSTITAV